MFPFREKVVPLQANRQLLFDMDLNSLIAECTAYDFKVMLKERKRFCQWLGWLPFLWH